MLSLDVRGRVLGRQRARRRSARRSRRAASRRSTRKVRQSSRRRSQATRYQRRPRLTSDVRLDLAPAVGAVAAAVGEAQALRVAAGGGDHRQVLRVDRRPADSGGLIVADPSARDAAAQVGGQHLLELDQRAHGGLLDAGHRGARGGAKARRRWRSPPRRRAAAAASRCRREAGSRRPGRSATRPGSRARAAARRRAGWCGRTPRAARPARARASRGAPGAARGAPGGGSRSSVMAISWSRELRTDPDLNQFVGCVAKPIDRRGAADARARRIHPRRPVLDRHQPARSRGRGRLLRRPVRLGVRGRDAAGVAGQVLHRAHPRRRRRRRRLDPRGRAADGDVEHVRLGRRARTRPPRRSATPAAPR